MPRNTVYHHLHNFKCEKIDDKTGKRCKGKLHPNERYTSVMDFICHTCNKYTTMSYEVANLINTETKKAPKQYREES